LHANANSAACAAQQIYRIVSKATMNGHHSIPTLSPDANKCSVFHELKASVQE
jgi:hypothetical protein